MNRLKGFSLAELLGVIVVLGIIALITFPIINNTIKNNKEKLYTSQLNEIKLSAEKWAYANLNLLPTNEDESITVTLLELKKSGYVPIDSRNPKTGELLPNDMIITITFKNNNYDIFVDGDSGTNLSNEFNENAPTIVLSGNYIEYVEINNSYEEKGAKAISKEGSEVEVNITYQENGREVGSIDVTKFSIYTVIYSATSNGYTSNITRTVVVRDTTSPNLVVSDTTELTIDQLKLYNLMEGISVSDNSGEVINVETRGFDRLPTDKIIEYKACDSNNNCTIKRKLIKIKDNTSQNLVMKDISVVAKQKDESTSKYKNYDNSYKFLNCSPMYFTDPGTDEDNSLTIGDVIDVKINSDDIYVYDFTSLGGSLSVKLNFSLSDAYTRFFPLYDSINSKNTEQIDWQLNDSSNIISSFDKWISGPLTNLKLKLTIPENKTNECQKYVYSFRVEAIQSTNVNLDSLNDGTLDIKFHDYQYDGTLKINSLVKPIYFTDIDSINIYIFVPPTDKTALSCNNSI